MQSVSTHSSRLQQQHIKMHALVTLFMFGSSGIQIYGPEVRDEGPCLSLLLFRQRQRSRAHYTGGPRVVKNVENEKNHV